MMYHESNLALAGDSTGGEHLVPLLLAFLAPRFPLPMLLLYAFSRIRQSDGIDPMGAPVSWSTPRDEAAHKAHQATQATHEAKTAAHKVVMQEQAERAPQPWPQAVPNLPPFPAGWEYAEPPSKAVQTRAWQLLEQLWARGEGSTVTELTDTSWITYRAEIVANGKRGVVAYRIRAGARPAPTAASSPAPIPLPPVAQVPATPTAPARPVLRQGSGMGALKGDAPWVAVVQVALGITPADGAFGPHTKDQVGAFQVRQGMVPDGIVGPRTWAALDTAAPNAAQALRHRPDHA